MPRVASQYLCCCTSHRYSISKLSAFFAETHYDRAEQDSDLRSSPSLAAQPRTHFTEGFRWPQRDYDAEMRASPAGGATTAGAGIRLIRNDTLGLQKH